MTNAEVMREVARRWAEGEGRDGLCITVREVLGFPDSDDLCYSDSRAAQQAHDIRADLNDRVSEMEPYRAAYAYPPDEDGMARSLASLWMAHEYEESRV